MAELLTVTDLRAGYGAADVLHGVSLSVGHGELVVLLGANGAGKTTTLRAFAGLERPWGGSVVFDGEQVDRTRPELIVRRGLGMVPAPPGIFGELTVSENLRVGSFAREGGGALERVLAVFPILRERIGQRAGSLSGGEQRRLAIARALMAEPRLLLVDEVSMGLSPVMVSETMLLLGRVRADGVAILMAEQTIAALDVADRAYVLDKGRVVRADEGRALEDTRRELAATYLGAAS